MNDPLAFLFTPTFDVLSENLSQNVSVQHIQENHSLETVLVFCYYFYHKCLLRSEIWEKWKYVCLFMDQRRRPRRRETVIAPYFLQKNESKLLVWAHSPGKLRPHRKFWCLTEIVLALNKMPALTNVKSNQHEKSVFSNLWHFFFSWRVKLVTFTWKLELYLALSKVPLFAYLCKYRKLTHMLFAKKYKIT